MGPFPLPSPRGVFPKLFRVDGRSEWMAFPDNGHEYFRNYSEWTAIPSGWLSLKTDTNISEAIPSGRPVRVDGFPETRAPQGGQEGG